MLICLVLEAGITPMAGQKSQEVQRVELIQSARQNTAGRILKKHISVLGVAMNIVIGKR